MSNNTKQFGESGVWRGWRELCGDVNWEDYGGKWGRQDPSNPRVFYVIKSDNMIEAMGERDVEACGCDVFQAQVVRVDLDDTSSESIESALKCCGLDLEDFTGDHDWAIVECLVDYGSAAPMGEHSHPHRADVARASARREVEELIADSEQCEAMLDRQVNAIGSTAREYGRGDMDSAMDRWRVSYRPADWLPYSFGYIEGLSGRDAKSDEDLAPEYLDGYRYGARVKEGKAPACSWIN